MDIFRHRKKSDEVLSGSELCEGRIVWIEGSEGREERIYHHGAVITMAEYHKQKAERAARNIEKNGHFYRRGRRRHTVHPSYPGGLVPGGVV